MNATTVRETQVNIRLSDEESAQFKRVADRLGMSIPSAIRLLMKQADEAIGDDARRAWLDAEPAWERDKRLVAWLVPIVNRFKLEVIADDQTRTFTIHSPRIAPVGTRGPLTRDETIDALVTWPGGDILMFDPRTRVVTYSPSRNGTVRVAEPPADAIDATALAELERWRERQLTPAQQAVLRVVEEISQKGAPFAASEVSRHATLRDLGADENLPKHRAVQRVLEELVELGRLESVGKPQGASKQYALRPQKR